jgi:hypothetical protein
MKFLEEEKPVSRLKTVRSPATNRERVRVEFDSKKGERA